MNFKINLKPYPAAPYFTVQEHLRRKEKYNPTEGSESVNRKLKELLGLPARYGNISLLKSVLSPDNYDFELVAKDDPLTGIDNLKKGVEGLGSKIMLDLSYSFPQITSEIPSHIEALLIDPSKSLGIPGEFAFLFSSSDTNAADIPGYSDDEGSTRNLGIVDAVLTDYEERGKEALLRESNYKAAVLYQMAESCPYLEAVADKEHRSKTMITVAVEPSFLSMIEKMGYEVGSHTKGEMLFVTIANYPTHSKELIEMFADRVTAL